MYDVGVNLSGNVSGPKRLHGVFWGPRNGFPMKPFIKEGLLSSDCKVVNIQLELESKKDDSGEAEVADESEAESVWEEDWQSDHD